MPGVRLLLVAGPALLANLAAAQIQGSEEPASEAGSPSLELLEFLGQWETDAGIWINPELLADPQVGMLIGMVVPEQPATDQGESVAETDDQDE